MSPHSAKAPASRLRFIDMARSIAILLMLEGHFADLALAPEWRRPGYLPYDVWHYVRGLTAPMFFTVTGLVFAYLLTGGHEESFWRSKRVRKGLVRASELIFWGYLLQVDIKRLPGIFQTGPDAWLQAFHVLQCIGVGLVVMVIGYGLLRKLKPPVLALAYAAAGFALYGFHIWLDNQAGHVPQWGAAWLQNTMKGQYSVFPIAPWLGFTLYGAALGVWVRWQGARLWLPSAPLTLFGIGLALRLGGWWLDRQYAAGLLSLTGVPPGARVVDQWFHSRAGEVFMVLGLLVAYESRFRPGDSWFLTIGRNTFPIYVLHVIVLYGGIFGIGLRNVMERNLSLWQSVCGALLFVALFAALAQLVAPACHAWKHLRSRNRNDLPD